MRRQVFSAAALFISCTVAHSAAGTIFNAGASVRTADSGDFSVARVPMMPGRRTALETALFHNPKARAEELRAWFGIDLFDGLDATDQALIRRMFLRRHVHEHNGGVVDQPYLDESGDTSVRLGQALREHAEDVFKLTGLIVKMARNFHRDFHVLFPPVAEPIRHETERKPRLEEYKRGS